MSHQPERKEKDCLNCGAEVAGRYCQVCGQENIITKQNFWSLAQHFVYDIFHFDGKFFDTLKYLIIRPGHVPREYIAGRRMSYLDPIRMYLFTSAIFFLVFFTFNMVNVGGEKKWTGRLSAAERLTVVKDLREKEVAGKTNSFERQAIDLLLDSTKRIYLNKIDSDEIDSAIVEAVGKVDSSERQAIGRLLNSTKRVYINRTDSSQLDSVIVFDGIRYELTSKDRILVVEADSSSNEGNWFKRTFKRKFAEIENRYDNSTDAMRTMMDQFVHRIPYMLFLSLPFFALILKLLYLRQKRFHYHEHLIFTLYHYIFTFMLMLVLMGVVKLANELEWSIFGFVIFAIIIYAMIYLYKGMRNFYGQSRGKTFLKFFLLNTMGFFLVNLLLFIFLLFTAIQF